MMEQLLSQWQENSGSSIAVKPRIITWLELHFCDTSLSIILRTRYISKVV